MQIVCVNKLVVQVELQLANVKLEVCNLYQMLGKMQNYVYMYTVADTGFSSGGGQIGREAPEKFFVPPLSSSGGGQSPP